MTNSVVIHIFQPDSKPADSNELGLDPKLCFVSQEHTECVLIYMYAL